MEIVITHVALPEAKQKEITSFIKTTKPIFNFTPKTTEEEEEETTDEEITPQMEYFDTEPEDEIYEQEKINQLIDVPITIVTQDPNKNKINEVNVNFMTGVLDSINYTAETQETEHVEFYDTQITPDGGPPKDPNEDDFIIADNSCATHDDNDIEIDDNACNNFVDDLLNTKDVDSLVDFCQGNIKVFEHILFILADRHEMSSEFMHSIMNDTGLGEFLIDLIKKNFLQIALNLESLEFEDIKQAIEIIFFYIFECHDEIEISITKELACKCLYYGRRIQHQQYIDMANDILIAFADENNKNVDLDFLIPKSDSIQDPPPLDEANGFPLPIFNQNYYSAPSTAPQSPSSNSSSSPRRATMLLPDLDEIIQNYTIEPELYEKLSVYQKIYQNKLQTIEMDSEYLSLKADLNQLHNENDLLKDRIKVLESNHERFNAEIDVYKQEIETLKHENTELRSQIDELTQVTETELEVEEKRNIVKDYFEHHMPQTATPLGWQMLYEMFTNMHKEGNGRRYSDPMRFMSFLVYNYSAGALRVLRTHFPFPGYDSFHNLLKKDEENVKASLLDKSKIPNFIKQTYQKYKKTTPIRVTLAIDAIAIHPAFLPECKKEFGSKLCQIAIESQVKDTLRLLPTKKKKKEFEEALKATPGSEEARNATINNAFIFYIEPHDPTIPCAPVYVHLKKGGSADDVIRVLTLEICNLIEKHDIVEIVCISTDGDAGHNHIYDLIYNMLVKMSPTLNIEELLSNEDRFHIKRMGATDLLHLFKTLRARFLNNNIDLFPSFEAKMSKDELPNILKPGPEVTDKSQIGKMRDSYAIHFFTFENLQRIINTGNFCHVTIFAPFVFWANAVFNSVLTIEARINLLKIAFELTKRMHNIIKSVDISKWNGTKQKNYKDTASALTVATDSVFRKMITTLFVLISELSDWDDVKNKNIWKYKYTKKQQQLLEMNDLGIERYGTHPLENFNGLIRDQSNSKDTCYTMQHVCAKTQMMKKISDKMMIHTVKRTRANAGGLKISEFVNIVDWEGFDPNTIVNTLFAHTGCITEFSITSSDINDDMLNAFIDWIIRTDIKSKIDHIQRIRLNNPSLIANSKINIRNSQFNK